MYVNSSSNCGRDVLFSSVFLGAAETGITFFVLLWNCVYEEPLLPVGNVHILQPNPAVAEILAKSLKDGANPEWPSGMQHCVCCTDGCGFKLWLKPLPMLPDMSVGTWIEKVLLSSSIQSAGVVPEVNLIITQVRKLTKRDPPWLWNPGQMPPEVCKDVLEYNMTQCIAYPEMSSENGVVSLIVLDLLLEVTVNDRWWLELLLLLRSNHVILFQEFYFYFAAIQLISYLHDLL